ncbi:uncharacterized protein H6S33_010058 [Morchella sextelata]|uniref:uncharacterized protein n=1 Tax=Morchella sextelata TaxID=1174677 RepID=UPI001D04DFB1|nr:uncharacterized protein H6S33_010058 [Morchella sextelata]KAH0612006.1 hypothetical protein H6S33_010058 [Morchella sextelata]
MCTRSKVGRFKSACSTSISVRILVSSNTPSSRLGPSQIDVVTYTSKTSILKKEPCQEDTVFFFGPADPVKLEQSLAHRESLKGSNLRSIFLEHDGSHWAGCRLTSNERGTGFGSSRCVSTQTESVALPVCLVCTSVSLILLPHYLPQGTLLMDTYMVLRLFVVLQGPKVQS